MAGITGTTQIHGDNSTVPTCEIECMYYTIQHIRAHELPVYYRSRADDQLSSSSLINKQKNLLSEICNAAMAFLPSAFTAW